MTDHNDFNLDDETIGKVGLQLSDNPINAEIAPTARVFKYPYLKDVFIMESDLYGNTMPKDSCFLVFNGQHGLIGKHLRIDTLKSASVEDINQIVQNNKEG